MKTIIQWIIISFSMYICLAGVPKRSVARTSPPLDHSIATRPVIFTILENSKIGTYVGRLLGKRCLGNPYYVLMTTDAPFIIYGITGSIYVWGSLDRERTSEYKLQQSIIVQDINQIRSGTDKYHPTTQKFEGNRYFFTTPNVRKYCGSQTEIIRVKIKIKDANDNAPVFKQSHYQSFVKVNANVGAFILRVTATDADTGTNGRVKYNITHQQSPPLFSIDPETGIITVGRRLNADYRSRSLTVTATDGGVPSLTGTTSVQIHIVARGS